MNGKTTLPGGYQVIKSLGNKDGAFNSGIYLVAHPLTGKALICKSLLTNSTARREVPALKLLQGLPGIITMVQFVPGTSSTQDFKSLDATALSHIDDEVNFGQTVDFEEMNRLNMSPTEYRKTHMDHIYLEYCNLGTLVDIKKRYKEAGERVPEALIWHVFYSIALALMGCHLGMGKKGWNQICHSDVTATNIMLKAPPEDDCTKLPKVVLADFGCAFHPQGSADARKERALEDVRSLASAIEEFCRSLDSVAEFMMQNREFRSLKSSVRLDLYQQMMKDDISVYSQELLELIDFCQMRNDWHTAGPTPDTLVFIIDMLRADGKIPEFNGKKPACI